MKCLPPAQQPLRGPCALLASCLKPGSLKSRWANFLLQLDTNSPRAAGTRSTAAVGEPPYLAPSPSQLRSPIWLLSESGAELGKRPNAQHCSSYVGS